MGSPNSSNSNKLKAVAEKAGARGLLVEDISEVNPSDLQGFNCFGLTAGASLPEDKIQQAIDWFTNFGVQQIEEVIVGKS